MIGSVITEDSAVFLREVTEEILSSVLKLQLDEAQKQYVASNANMSCASSWRERVNRRPG